MTETATELERRLLRLLRAYPRWYRKQRGEELLGTLLDSAADDQLRPSSSQRRDIIRNGIACRFRVRGGPASVVLAVCVALVCALIGSCVGSLLSWLDEPDLPSRDATAAIATGAFDGVKPDVVRGDGSLFTYDMAIAEEITHGIPAWVSPLVGRFDYVKGTRVADVDGGWSRQEWHAVMFQVPENLKASGWRVTESDVHDEYVNPDARSFHLSAIRDGHVLTVNSFSGDASAELRIVRADPAGQPAGLIVGAGCGLLAGWLLAVRLAWQLTVHHPRRFPSTLALTWLAATFGAPPWFASVYTTGLILTSTDPAETTSPPWWMVNFVGYRPLCLLAGSLAIAAILTATLPGRRRNPAPTVTGHSPNPDRSAPA